MAYDDLDEDMGRRCSSDRLWIGSIQYIEDSGALSTDFCSREEEMNEQPDGVNRATVQLCKPQNDHESKQTGKVADWAK